MIRKLASGEYRLYAPKKDKSGKRSNHKFGISRRELRPSSKNGSSNILSDAPKRIGDLLGRLLRSRQLVPACWPRRAPGPSPTTSSHGPKA